MLNQLRADIDRAIQRLATRSPRACSTPMDELDIRLTSIGSTTDLSNALAGLPRQRSDLSATPSYSAHSIGGTEATGWELRFNENASTKTAWLGTARKWRSWAARCGGSSSAKPRCIRSAARPGGVGRGPGG